VTAVEGNPMIEGRPVDGSGSLRPGERLATDSASSASLRVGTLGNVEVEPDSRLRLVASGPSEQRLALERGRISATIAAPPRVFLVDTPSARAIDLGCAYTLDVDVMGATFLRVTSGWVELEWEGRRSLVPAGSACRSKPGVGPGTPYLVDAPQALRTALYNFDFENGGDAALEVVLRNARYEDGLMLWHLLPKTSGRARENVFGWLATYVPPPEGVTGDGILALDAGMLDAYRRKLEYVAVGVAPDNVPPVPGRLEPGGTMTTARLGHTAALLADGRVLVAGGIDGYSKHPGFGPPHLDSAEVYDPSAKTFAVTGRMTQGRCGHTATPLRDGRVLVVGGGASPVAEVYDPRQGVFRQVGSLDSYRAYHQATVLANGLVLITGGDDGKGGAHASAELYDPATSTFRPTGSMLGPRALHTATLLADGRVLVAGGGTGGLHSNDVLNTAEIYDPATGTFRPAGMLTAARQKHGAVLLGDGRVLLAGGVYDDLRDEVPANAEVFDPTTSTFAPVRDMNTTHFKVLNAVVMLPSGKVCVAGGGSFVEVFDPATNLFSRVESDVDAARYYASATALPDGSVLIVGGSSRNVDAHADAVLFR
jgi:hypothetical protein